MPPVAAFGLFAGVDGLAAGASARGGTSGVFERVGLVVCGAGGGWGCGNCSGLSAGSAGRGAGVGGNGIVGMGDKRGSVATISGAFGASFTGSWGIGRSVLESSVFGSSGADGGAGPDGWTSCDGASCTSETSTGPCATSTVPGDGGETLQHRRAAACRPVASRTLARNGVARSGEEKSACGMEARSGLLAGSCLGFEGHLLDSEPACVVQYGNGQTQAGVFIAIDKDPKVAV